MKNIAFLAWLNYFTWHWTLVFGRFEASIGFAIGYCWFLILAVFLTMLHLGLEWNRKESIDDDENSH